MCSLLKYSYELSLRFLSSQFSLFNAIHVHRSLSLGSKIYIAPALICYLGYQPLIQQLLIGISTWIVQCYLKLNSSIFTLLTPSSSYPSYSSQKAFSIPIQTMVSHPLPFSFTTISQPTRHQILRSG